MADVNAAALDLMTQRIEDDIIARLEAMKPDPNVALLNKTFGFKWSWAIVDSGAQEYESQGIVEYSMVGRLFIPGMGFRDGIGSAKTPADAGKAALRDAILKAGLDFGDLEAH